MTAQPQVTGVASAAPVPGTAPIDPDVPTRERPFAGSPAARLARTTKRASSSPKPRPSVITSAVPRCRRPWRTPGSCSSRGTSTGRFLTGGATAPFLDLLDPDTGAAEGLAKAIAHPDDKNGTALWLDHPLRRPPRGRTRRPRGQGRRDRGLYEIDGDGILTIRTDYSFVYAVAKAGHPDSEVTRALMRRVVDTQVIGENTRYQPTAPGKLVLAGGSAQASNSSCDVLDGYVRPYFDDTVPRIQPSGPEGGPVRPRQTAGDRRADTVRQRDGQTRGRRLRTLQPHLTGRREPR
ncbi:hypothetical protein ACU686_23660 [Yinghuangia aomiensis]